ncbi:hypothetical protein [Mesotoga sp.]|uniref:InlB B-repeat-containing protein n=1 Tax=Mesotoga sp. TaxID=2053577 RepID=UPI00345EF1DA
MGWEFVNWLVGEAEETDNPLEITMDSDKTVTAVFAQFLRRVHTYHQHHRRRNSYS